MADRPVMTMTRRLPSEWIVPLILFVLAAAVRLAVAWQLPFPTTEGSAYYAGVAANLVQGHGLVSDAVWSYATPPLVVPKPAFELWMPLSSLVSAAAMALLGSTFWAAQVGSALLGALLAPLAWVVAREAAAIQGLDRRRGRAVALAAGLLACVAGPLVISAAVPDSYTPFAVFSVLGALLAPRALGVDGGRPWWAGRPSPGHPTTPMSEGGACDPDIDGGAPHREMVGVEPSPEARVAGWPRPSRMAGLALGVTLGLAYLSRQEAIWLGFVVLVVVVRSAGRSGALVDRLRVIGACLWPIVLGGLMVVAPWLLRNLDIFGSPFPGQALENMVLRGNEDIFAFRDRPTLAGYLDQGMATILANPLRAAWEVLVDVLLVSAFPIGVAGLAAVVGLRRAPALRRVTALSILLASGGLTFLSTCLLFPVATRWGTFLHASGPLLVGLVVAAALGGDALLARISGARRWQQPNVLLAPVALLTMTLLLCLFQVSVTVSQSRQLQARYEVIATAVEHAVRDAGDPLPAVLITDHPMYLAHASGQATLVLPAEAPASVLDIAARFGATWLVVVDERGPYPDVLLSEPGMDCLTAAPVALEGTPEGARLFRLARECRADADSGLRRPAGSAPAVALYGGRPSDGSASPYTRGRPIGREERSEADEMAARCSGSCRTPGRNVA